VACLSALLVQNSVTAASKTRKPSKLLLATPMVERVEVGAWG